MARALSSIRPLALALLVLGAAGCPAATQIVAARDLSPLLRADQRAPLFLRTVKGKGVRLDPNSDVRLLARDGAYTPWMRAAALAVGPRGLRYEQPVRYDQVATARVTGMDPMTTELLQLMVGDGMTRVAAGGWELRGGSPAGWLHRIIRSAAIAHAGASYERYREANRCTDTPCPPLLSLEDFALRQAKQEGAGLGTWTFAAASGGWTRPVDPLSFIQAPRTEPTPAAGAPFTIDLPVGPGQTEGLTWDQIAHLEISNVSGAKTFGGVIGTLALTAALLPVAGVASMAGGSFGSGGGSGGGGAAVNLAGHVGGGTGGDGDPPEPSVPRPPGPRLEDAAITRSLFGWNMRRQAIVRFVFALDGDVGTDYRRLDGVHAGSLLAFRFLDIIEVGVAVRSLLTLLPADTDRPASSEHAVIGAFHLGLHLDMDARRRVAIPLAVDLGSGGPVRFQGRIQLGLRVRVAGPFSVGIYPLTPVVTLAHDNTALSGAPTWTFRSGIETVVAF